MAFTWVRPQQEFDPEIEAAYPSSDEAEDDTGQQLNGRYDLIETIAWGGTAAIYRAYDLVLKTDVVVKVLCSGLREQSARYFDQEGRISARISNPHLVRAHDRGIDDGRPFIVFHLVHGCVLPQLHGGLPMPWSELCEVVLGILDGLHALHEAGVVHRDVKPDNVIVRRRPGQGSEVMLLDLGCCAVLPERRITLAPEPSRTVYGTCGYIAPEYFAGHLPDPRCDLFSVGALMYAMLTTASLGDVRDLGLFRAIPPPRVVVPDVEIPEAVEDIVMRALSDIEARYQSAREMSEAIRAVLAPAPVERVGMVPAMAELVAAEQVALSSTFEPGEQAPVPTFMSVEQAASPAERPVLRGRWWELAKVGTGAVLGGVAVLGVMSLGTGASLPATAARSGEILTSTSTLTPAVLTPAAIFAGSSEEPKVTARPVDAPGAGSVPVAREPARAPGAPPNGTARAPAGLRKTRPPVSTAGNFKMVMASLEPKARQCARDSEHPEEPVTVKVRVETRGGPVTSVRVWKLSSSHPFARCIDGIVRAAKPSIDDVGLVEAFEFFGKA